MHGYIAVADDLQFHGQTVTVGATLTVDKSRLSYATITDIQFGSSQREQRIWKTFHSACEKDTYSFLYLYSTCVGESPIYRRRVFEVELGGNAVVHSQRNDMWSCDTITILREITWNMMKVNKTNVEAINSHRARNFDGPFTREAICDLLDDMARTMVKLFPWWGTVIPEHMGATLTEVIASYALFTSEWAGTQVCDTIVDVFRESTHLQGRPIDHIEYLLKSYLGNQNLSLETRLQIRDEIRAWVAGNGLFDEPGVHVHVTLLSMDDFLAYIPRTVNRLTSVEAYNRAIEFCRYLEVSTAQEVNTLLEFWLEIKTPQDAFHCKLPEGTSEELLCRLLDSTEYQAARYDIEKALANLNPYNEHNYHSEHAVHARIVHGDISTMEDNLQTDDWSIQILLTRFGTEDIQHRLMRHKDSDVRASVAKYACADIVHALRTDRSAAVRAAVAHRGFDEDLDVLVHDRSPMVRHCVLDNARTTDINYLRHDTVGTIQKRAQKAILQS